jgi:hypothetical protein
MDPKTHRRYLEYREKYVYFVRGENKPAVHSQTEFMALEAELKLLEAKGEEGRDDEEAARFEELLRELLLD